MLVESKYVFAPMTSLDTRAMYTYWVKVKKIVDGDTIDVDLDLGCHVQVHKRLRLLGIDTYELRRGSPEQKKRGREAAEFVGMELIDSEVVIRTEMDAVGKFGRLLAWVFYRPGTNKLAPWKCLNVELVRGGHTDSHSADLEQYLEETDANED